MDLSSYIRDVPDFPKPGILFKDITPLLAEPRAFRHTIDLFLARYRGMKPDVIASAEARGFLFAAPLALDLQLPFVPLRKPGKLPHTTHSFAYELEYGKAELHVHIDAIRPGARVLLLDDVLATGGTMRAACHLIEKAGGSVLECAFLIELEFLAGRARLDPYPVFRILKY
jgi:adenine phosphoribosyltransferase